MIKNKRCLVTGGAGSIGSELVRQLSKDNKVFVLDFNEIGVLNIINNKSIFGRVGDIRDKETVKDVFSDFKPQIVFHAAAYKSVDMMEGTPLEAIQTNIIGTYNMIDIARRWECVEKFVFISSDKAIQSYSIMGATKRVGEIITKNQGKGYVAVRFGNVLGSRGSVIPIWQEQINQGKPITITDERMERYFMTIEEACELVIKAAEIGEGGEIMVMDMGERVNILDMAKSIIKETHKDIPIEIIGIRPGEVLVEELMTEEEKGRAKKIDKFWIIK
jgi:FlaA1/EpsC-like NDP-sugar epimerase